MNKLSWLESLRLRLVWMLLRGRYDLIDVVCTQTKAGKCETHFFASTANANVPMVEAHIKRVQGAAESRRDRLEAAILVRTIELGL